MDGVITIHHPGNRDDGISYSLEYTVADLILWMSNPGDLMGIKAVCNSDTMYFIIDGIASTMDERQDAIMNVY